MPSRIDDLLARAAHLEREVEAELNRARSEWRYRIIDGRIRFERDVRLAHQRLKQSIPRFLRESNLASVLTAPMIYSMIVPIALRTGATSALSGVRRLRRRGGVQATATGVARRTERRRMRMSRMGVCCIRARSVGAYPCARAPTAVCIDVRSPPDAPPTPIARQTSLRTNPSSWIYLDHGSATGQE